MDIEKSENDAQIKRLVEQVTTVGRRRRSRCYSESYSREA